MTRVCKRFENASFDSFIGNKELVDTLRKAKEIKNNIVIIGGVGTGKTYLAYALLNQEAEKKSAKGDYRYYSSNFVRYATIKEIIEDIRKCWGKSADKYDWYNVDNYKNVPLLIIDEIGVQYGSDSERIELFEIFNERYNEMLPTIAISNYNRQQIEKTLGLRITDRLFGSSKIFELSGESHR